MTVAWAPRLVPLLRRGRRLALPLLLAIPGARLAAAHGFGQRYDLPLPLPLWIGGAGASIVLSFAVVALFLRRSPRSTPGRGRDLLASPLARVLCSAPVVAMLRFASSGLWMLAIAAGLLGEPDAYRNIAPTLVWVVGWVGLSFASIFLGDVWRTFHPIGSLFGAAESLVARATGGGAGRGRASLGWQRRWPDGLGHWPAVLFFAVFAWLELVWSASDVPSSLGAALAIYTGITLVGMLVFGRDVWLERAEFFAVAFGILARFAPFALRPSTAAEPRVFRLRVPGAGLLEGLPLPFSHMIFVLLMLSTVTFDGFLETQQWLDTADRWSIAPWMQPVLGAFRSLGFSDDEGLASVGFALLPVVFVSVTLAFSWATRRAAIAPGGARVSETPGALRIARTLVATLVPIAIAYHLAHYLSMLVVSGQYAIPLVSDPFGFGWDLFGTAGYEIDIGIIGVRFVWNFAAIAIVSGHVVSVVLAHILALRDFETHRAALWSQAPVLALMVGYTMLSLWILAQPIVE